MSGVLPRWEIDSLFPSLRSRQMTAAREGLVADMERMRVLFDRNDVGPGPARAATGEDRGVLSEIFDAMNDLLGRLEPLGAYLHALVATDARDDEAAAAQAALDADLVALDGLRNRLDAWVARLGADGLTSDEDGGEYAHLLRRAEVAASHQMSQGQEELLSELRLSGSSAWTRLAGDLTSTLTGVLDGERLPVTVLRGKATDADRALRERAFRAELAAWETVAVPMAACLNGVKGEGVTVNRRRGWPDALGPALFSNSVERVTLDAMQAAATASFPDFRRFLRAKARLLAAPTANGGLAWWDLMAPVPGESSIEWSAAEAAVERAFATYSPGLGAHARRAFDARWVDAEPRDGKRGGAFCMSVGDGDSRILMNFDGSWDSVQTLAHELGHAYHNVNLAGRPPLQQRTPMALAETASIFCETVMVEAGLAAADPASRLALLNVDLQGAAQTVVDIHSRFLFERHVFEKREVGPLSVRELCEAMTDAQRSTYGDGLDDSTLHPWMWAVKPHYYSVGQPFYNWPYCFGLLFGVGLYARFRSDPDRFRAGYDDLLSSTGTGTAAELAGRFDIDVRSEGFWTSSLDVIRARIDEFVGLVDGAVGPGSPAPGR
ncbi:M3 family oligoendopeptidase [Acidiferrimicrobium sp. IK]|uniref:M3 family oligoendopeptidase n=1 Tax=Acidiferrimicrobium sp. IK TaxID=2871700 RepID=UPI0021CAEFA4|nr:M3 family oligoendopeptidase [Acidiferrimicrobium sp. IK]MCU4183134.1 M3 family oligoendopeptidase [Acidiferrimicrobium sp. IK]